MSLITDADPTFKPPETPHESAKNRIVAAAIRLFCEKGYEATPVREIVEAAGVTKPVLYYYFASKETLFQSIIRETLQAANIHLAEICAPENDADFRRQLAQIIAFHVEAAKAQPDLVRFMHSTAFSGIFEKVFDFSGWWKRSIELIGGVFERAQSRGQIRGDLPAAVVATHFTGMVVNIMRGIVYCPEAVGGDANGDTILPTLFEGIDKSREAR